MAVFIHDDYFDKKITSNEIEKEQKLAREFARKKHKGCWGFSQKEKTP